MQRHPRESLHAQSVSSWRAALDLLDDLHELELPTLPSTLSVNVACVARIEDRASGLHQNRIPHRRIVRRSDERLKRLERVLAMTVEGHQVHVRREDPRHRDEE